MSDMKMHPSELAYAFSYSRTDALVGWGSAPFDPPAGTDRADFLADGANRLAKAGRLVEAGDKGMTFTDAVTTTILALIDPILVLMAERKVGDGLRRLTVHMSNEALIGLTQDPEGSFQVVRYADIAAAAAACAGFLGASRTPAEAGARLETSQKALSDVHRLATSGQQEAATSELAALGLDAANAGSAAEAMASPVASGLLSVLYCTGNVAQNATPHSVMTNAAGDSWIAFPPGSLDGTMVLERSSAPALAGRVAVSVMLMREAAA